MSQPPKNRPSLSGRSPAFILAMILIAVGGTVALLLGFMLIERLLGG